MLIPSREALKESQYYGKKISALLSQNYLTIRVLQIPLGTRLFIFVGFP
jgi:hypothetical protein